MVLVQVNWLISRRLPTYKSDSQGCFGADGKLKMNFFYTFILLTLLTVSDAFSWSDNIASTGHRFGKFKSKVAANNVSSHFD